MKHIKDFTTLLKNNTTKGILTTIFDSDESLSIKDIRIFDNINKAKEYLCPEDKDISDEMFTQYVSNNPLILIEETEISSSF